MAKNGHRQLDLAAWGGRRRVRISDSDILRHVGARAMEAGRIYTRQGRIVSFEERPPEIAALVRGSLSVPYRVSVTVTPAESEGLRIKGRCSCPVGAYCKHIAAALIESRLRHPDVAATRQGELFVAKPDSQAPAGELLPLPISHWIAALERAGVGRRRFSSGGAKSSGLCLFAPRISPRALPPAHRGGFRARAQERRIFPLGFAAGAFDLFF